MEYPKTGMCRCGRWRRASRPRIVSNLQESWSKVSHAARELATEFSVTFFFFYTNSWSIGQNAPPQQKVSRHITAIKDEIKRAGTLKNAKIDRKVGRQNLHCLLSLNL